MLAVLVAIGFVAAAFAVWGLVSAWQPRAPDAIVVPDKDVAAEDAAWRDRIDRWADDGVLDEHFGELVRYLATVDDGDPTLTWHAAQLAFDREAFDDAHRWAELTLMRAPDDWGADQLDRVYWLRANAGLRGGFAAIDAGEDQRAFELSERTHEDVVDWRKHRVAHGMDDVLPRTICMDRWGDVACGAL